MKKYQKKTDEEKAFNKLFRSLVTKVKADCATTGLRAVEFKYEYLKGNPSAQLPSPPPIV